ncbi:MAG: hypothetical protein COZ34_02690 [Candidatus Pacebacteria bacterium CG_4_10_14_3_um_filter_34_15]|nr:HAD-IA family hydrolase [Candidatus Pacearchaeota archaeon]NCQ66078.1 HAD-IA family hydrolase [Candidatus Paceibacterota bacterium]OIO45222.1 MAG: hypothetical protein AUJ41_00460 [Candidatus Pacebacteria bacterium CG1_02_43_31]PIQ81094.1 MAG: hypothetical protein COV78_02105 [Candidatus Pacebacteria bacterium CG11_big_fil_rev_8_21_14_0_20_34_55]PIX81556.1 MAG: hypothetical protein COZ34_02690 [Candidatus Pacebacteria bacterium CG_4_10_14_3_um_filter_34_15]PJC43943.1 MAG: hypothetical prote
MINTILSDFSHVILFPKDKIYTGKLNALNDILLNKYGDYDFFNYFEFNQPLLDFYKSLKEKYSINIFTSGTVQNNLSVRKIIDQIFDNIYTAKDYGVNKTDSTAYELIAKKLNRKTNDIFFVDDQKENLQAAEEAGMTTVLYKDILQFKKEAKKVLT